MAMRWTALALIASLWACSVAAMELDPSLPPRLRQHSRTQPLHKGFVDPTREPYNAAGDGVTDDLSSLREAISDAFAARMSIFLPGGLTFLLSGQLLMERTHENRTFGFQLVGGGGTDDVPRPVLKLMDGTNIAPCCGVAEGVFVMFHMVQDGEEHPEAHYNSRIRNIDIDVGDNHRVSGLSMSSAQLCSIEDVSVSGRNFYAGINGLPGSGGFSVNVEVIGGQYGVVQNQYRPNPSISGAILLRQSKVGLLVNVSRGPVVLSGFHIQSKSNVAADYRAILLANKSTDLDYFAHPWTGQDNAFNGEDGKIVILGDEPGTAIETLGSDVVLKNVFTKGCTKILDYSVGDVALRDNAASDTWVQVPLYAFTADGSQMYDQGQNVSTEIVQGYQSLPLQIGMAPPKDLSQRHSWVHSDIPNWNDDQVLNVVLDYGATPNWINATDDDGDKIQKAIDDVCDVASPEFGYALFVPRGEFLLLRSLDLRGCARLFGAGSHSTVLVMASTWDASTAMVSASAGGASGEQLLSDLTLGAFTHHRFIDLQAGAKTLLRDVSTIIWSSKVDPVLPPLMGSLTGDPKYPYVSIGGAVGGKFFGLTLGGITGGHASSPPGPLHVLILVNGTRGHGNPIHFYQASTEHLSSDRQVLVIDSSDVHFHAWKYESPLVGQHKSDPPMVGSLASLVNCSDVSAFGGSGHLPVTNASKPIFDLIDTESVFLAGMVRGKGSSKVEPQAGVHWVVDTKQGRRTAAVGGYKALMLYSSTSAVVSMPQLV